MAISESDTEWLGIADMMAVLMMVFLFLTVLFLLKIEHEKGTLEEQQQNVTDITQIYKDHEIDLREALFIEFGSDLDNWGVEIIEEHTIRFSSPKVKFASGSSEIQHSFALILNDFFPRYVEILKQHKLYIDEVRIEGHTSTQWEHAQNDEERYLNNMQLSQQRSLEVLKYCYSLLSGNAETQKWLEKTMRANGVAFSEVIVDEGFEIPLQSRRVEFQVKTTSKESIEQIIDAISLESIINSST